MTSEPVNVHEARARRWLVMLGLFVAFVVVGSEVFPSKPALALDNPVRPLNDTEITVPAAATELRSISADIKSYDVVYIGNSLTTCIRVGGSTLTTTSGFDIGSGCRDGPGVTIEATSVFVMDDGGGTVAGVDVVWGKR